MQQFSWQITSHRHTSLRELSHSHRHTWRCVWRCSITTGEGGTSPTDSVQRGIFNRAIVSPSTNSPSKYEQSHDRIHDAQKPMPYLVCVWMQQNGNNPFNPSTLGRNFHSCKRSSFAVDSVCEYLQSLCVHQWSNMETSNVGQNRVACQDEQRCSLHTGAVVASLSRSS